MARYLKHLIYIIPIVLAVTAKALGIIDAPAKIEKVEVKAEENEDAIKEQRSNFEQYMAVQHTKEIKDQEFTDRLIKILEGQSK